jgi:hypothetical protein
VGVVDATGDGRSRARLECVTAYGAVGAGVGGSRNRMTSANITYEARAAIAAARSDDGSAPKGCGDP